MLLQWILQWIYQCTFWGFWLIFPFSSWYDQMLDKLRDRWTNTGLWEKMENLKTVIAEPRGGGKGDFDELLQAYYDAIKYCDERGEACLSVIIIKHPSNFYQERCKNSIRTLIFISWAVCGSVKLKYRPGQKRSLTRFKF